MLMDHAHDDLRPMLAQDYGFQPVKVQFSLCLLHVDPDLTEAQEAVEHGKFNVIITTQLPIVLSLRAPTLIMCVRPIFIVRRSHSELL